MYSSLPGWQGKYDDDAAADSTGVGDAGAVDRMLVEFLCCSPIPQQL